MKKFYILLAIYLALSACGIAKPKVSYDRDGGWSGNTPDGTGAFYMVIGNGGIRIINITGLPGCGQYIIYFDEPQPIVIENNEFAFDTQYLSVSGVFSDNETASGIYEINHKLCNEHFENTWEANKGPSFILTPPPQTIDMPETKIPKDLFQPNGGTHGFGPSPLEPYSKGDWDLSIFRLTNSYVPIPRGWTVVQTKNQMIIQPSYLENTIIVLGLLGKDSDNKTIQEALIDAEAQSKASISIKETIDSNKGYIFGTAQLTPNDKVNELIIISKDRLGRYNFFRAVTYSENWKDYFPIVQDMLKYWALSDNKQMGIDLPNSMADN